MLDDRNYLFACNTSLQLNLCCFREETEQCVTENNSIVSLVVLKHNVGHGAEQRGTVWEF